MTIYGDNVKLYGDRIINNFYLNFNCCTIYFNRTNRFMFLTDYNVELSYGKNQSKLYSFENSLKYAAIILVNLVTE